LTETNAIEANGTLSADDSIAAHQALGPRASNRFLAIDTALIAIGIASWLWLDKNLGMLFIAIGGVALGLGIVSTRLSLPRRVRTLFEQQRSLHEPFNYRFDHDGVHVRIETWQADRPWSYYRRWRATSGCFLIFQSDTIFEVLPKRWLSNPDILRAMLKARIG
jgi:hypothetical protein